MAEVELGLQAGVTARRSRWPREPGRVGKASTSAERLASTSRFWFAVTVVVVETVVVVGVVTVNI